MLIYEPKGKLPIGTYKPKERQAWVFAEKSFGFKEKYSQKLNNKDEGKMKENGSFTGGGFQVMKTLTYRTNGPGFNSRFSFICGLYLWLIRVVTCFEVFLRL